jgi:undecaprenyl-diphosphatase
MTWFHAFLLGVLEGLTEFLPVSSTGHLILLGSRLGYESETAKTLDVVIQLGAVIAVIVYYRARLAELVRGLFQRNPTSVRLAVALGIAFLPAAAVGFAFQKVIEKRLFGPIPVAQALIAGGVLMMGIELFRRRRGVAGEARLEAVTPRRALIVGIAQCFSLWPGTSRSMSTIVGGQLSGLSTATAADFSFLLAIPTLGAATMYKLGKSGGALLDVPGGASALIIGTVVSFVVALLVISAFLRYLKRFGLIPFGIYRIMLGAAVLIAAPARVAAPPHENGAPSAEGAAPSARAVSPGEALSAP